MSTNAALSSNTLTERYVQEVIRRVPADQRDEIADELRTTIADTIEARAAADPLSTEREVLSEMGDPSRLAARYADRPLSLIGPALYPAYRRLMRVLLTAVLPVVVVVLVVLDIVDGKDLGAVLQTAVGMTVALGAQLVAWPTVVFALVERSRYRASVTARGDGWTPDHLPEVPQRDRKGGAGALAAVVGNALLLGLIVWQHTARPYVTDGGERMEILDPALWSGWIWPVLAGLGALVVLNLIRVAAGRWTTTTATWYAAAQAVFALPAAWILYNHMIFNQEFLTDFNKGWTTPEAFYTAMSAGVLLVAASAVVTRFRQARA
ncbi:HAAS signaling domain-containing protein [Streptosporangium longisporum]|uniref:Permease prefix domain 1-containing protein n=1 Tax=Streptosporangium longisporum TaxID=46187 RepID=A0ABP6KFY4_9ACTN